MTITKIEDESKLLLTLNCPLVIHHAAAIRDELLDCFTSDMDLELDLGNVTDCDAAGVQLIYAAKKSADTTTISFTLKNIPQVVLNTIKIAGLDPENIAPRSDF